MATANERLRTIREGKYGTAVEAARAMGAKEATYIQHENGTRGSGSIPRSAAEKYAAFFRVSLDWLLQGKGDEPEIGSGPIPPSNAKVVAFEGASLEQPAENLPVWGTGLGAERMFDGEAVEQTDLNSGVVMEYVKRPAILRDKKGAYGLHVQGSSMHPALPDGEFVVACRDMPLSRGDNVVVYLRDEKDDDGERSRGVLVKELVRRSSSYVELRQYEPRMEFRVATADVIRIDYILTRREMLS